MHVLEDKKDKLNELSTNSRHKPQNNKMNPESVEERVTKEKTNFR